jgi:hypothetical protein
MNVRENGSAIEERTIQNHSQHWAHTTQMKDKQRRKKKKITPQDITTKRKKREKDTSHDNTEQINR